MRYYETVWAVSRDYLDRPASILFNDDMQFERVDVCDSSYFMLCLMPRSWGTDSESASTNTDLGDKLRQACLLLISSECSGYVFRRSDFERIGNKGRDS